MERRIPPSPPFPEGGGVDADAAVPPFVKGGLGGIPDYDQKLALTDFSSRLKPNARKLRKHQTDAEHCLWRHLRGDQLGVRFLRQRPLGQYIVDFYSPKARLVIELDGSQHADDPDIREKDTRRDSWLKSKGLRVLRFDDRQVLTETRNVLEVIFNAVGHTRGIPPNPPFLKGGELKGGEPRAVAEGFLPLECVAVAAEQAALQPRPAPCGQKGGQEGFNDPGHNSEGRK